MKKIYVTVSEFLENGGHLTPGRKVYWGQNEYQCSIFKSWYQSLKGLYLVENSDFPLSTECTYVEIECQPIYK